MGRKSLIRDYQVRQSRVRNVSARLSARLRAARDGHGLSQTTLAEKVGLRQRQISDLERGATDSRLTTVQNVARALDLELILIPRHLIPAVEALQRSSDAARRPLYSLDESEETETSGDVPIPVEAGDTSGLHTTVSSSAGPKTPRR